MNKGLVGWWLRDLVGRHDDTLTDMAPATDWVGSKVAMNTFTLKELCWLWDQADDHYAPSIADKLYAVIDAKSSRPLDDDEIRALASKWRSEFDEFESGE